MSSVQIFPGRAHDLGDLTVRRVLPTPGLRMVGPFVFLDHIGPVDFAAGAGIDVRPHPHVGLATVTYLYTGALLHRDSLGSVQTIRPGDINWMSAGSGIVHSERTPPSERRAGATVHGLQAWVALPDGEEDSAPAFSHHSAASLPTVQLPGAALRVLAGQAYGARSPVPVRWPTLCAEAQLEAASTLLVAADYAQRAVYVVAGAVSIAGAAVATGELALLPAGEVVSLHAEGPAQLFLLGGAAFERPRLLWWNFVASSAERIEAARQRWAEGRFAAVPGETEFIPLPPRA